MMTHEDMVEQVETLLTSDKPIPARLRNELILTLLINVHRSTRQLRSDVQKDLQAVRAEVAQVREGISADVAALQTSSRAEMDLVRKDVAEVRTYSIALWVRDNKRLAMGLGLSLLVAANLWFESGTLRAIVAWLIGVPLDLLP